MKQAAGTLLFRFRGDSIEVLLVHPSGNYNRKAPWSIPKGELDEGEDLLAAARRETREEAGVEAGELFSLGHIDYTKSRKRVHCFAGRAAEDTHPHCASWEVDRAEFVSIVKARVLIHRDQAPFLDRLTELLKPK
jgi:predicted NUDIX family NTP pyrophosphohydrolase